MIGIYMIQNKINGKIYIGQSIDIKRRWREHKNNSKNRNCYFYCALRKYGIENFSFSVLEECSIKELDYLERKYISLYHSLDKDFGYNIEFGGNVPGKRSLETKEKIKATKSKNPYIYSKESKEKMSLSAKSRKEHKLSKILCIETREEKYASEWIKLGYRGALENAKGIFKQCKGKHFKFVGEIKAMEKRMIKCIETGEILSAVDWRKKGYSLAPKVAFGDLGDTKGKHFEFVDGTSAFKEKYAKCLESNEILSLTEWKKKGFANVGAVCNGIRKTCNGKHFEFVA